MVGDETLYDIIGFPNPHLLDARHLLQQIHIVRRTHGTLSIGSSSRCDMANLTNLTSYFPPIPIPPIAPDFLLCHSAYGNGLSQSHEAALRVAGTLPHGTIPSVYTVNDEEAPPGVYELPYQTYSRDVSITVDVSGPADIDTIRLVPNEIRGMAAYVANRCIGAQGKGGFITNQIQGLVNFVTDPTSNLYAPNYPPDSVFVTVLVSDLRNANSFPGDHDPQLAYFLWEVEEAALRRAQPQDRDIFSGRVLRYMAQASRMTRLGNVAWWDDITVEVNVTETAVTQSINAAPQGVATSRQRKRLQRLLPSQDLEYP